MNIDVNINFELLILYVYFEKLLRKISGTDSFDEREDLF